MGYRCGGKDLENDPKLFVDQDEGDEEEALLEAVGRGANVVEDDASRGTLHYGSDHESEGRFEAATDGEGVSLDHEEAAAITLEVTATDSSGASHT